MQLSFVYFAAVFAASAWASPVPNSANQALTTRSLSERAVAYYQDSAHAISFYITSWLHTNHTEDFSFGDSGGDPFTDLPTLHGLTIAPTITKFTARSGERVNQVTLSGFVGARNIPYTSAHGHDAQSFSDPANLWDVSLDLEAGEWLTYVELQTTDVGLVYIKVATNLQNWVEAGSWDGTRPHQISTAPEGYTQVVGFYGNDGDWVDRIGPIWA